MRVPSWLELMGWADGVKYSELQELGGSVLEGVWLDTGYP